MKKMIFLSIFLVSTIVLVAFFTDSVDFVVKCFLVFSLVALTVTPIVAALLFFLTLLFSIYKRILKNFAIKIANDKNLEDTVVSHLYFVADMGPSVSSVSIVALFVATDASVTKLTVMFIFGILMKYVARKLIKSFYRIIRKIQGRDNERRPDSGN